MLKTIIDSVTGKELYATFKDAVLSENQVVVPEVRTTDMVNPHFNFETREFYDVELPPGSIPEVVTELQPGEED
jgi:hypothetical protein